MEMGSLWRNGDTANEARNWHKPLDIFSRPCMETNPLKLAYPISSPICHFAVTVTVVQ